MFLATAAPALAHDQGWSKGKEKHRSSAVRRSDDDRDRDHGRRAVIVTRRPARTRNTVFFGGGDDRPPGWSRGRKVGWGNCDLPPGQAKKYGCSPAFLRRSVLVRYPIRNYPVYGYQYRLVRVPVDYRGWYVVDDRNRLWVDDRGYWLDRGGPQLTIVVR